LAIAEPGKSIDRCIVYGERPITELSLVMMTDEDLGSLIREIELSDGRRIPFDGQTQSLQVFVEAPLGRQFGVVDILLAHNDFSVMCEVKSAAYDSVSRRLESQIPRYLSSLAKETSRRQTAFVRQIQSIVSGKKVYLAAVTKDSEFPLKLKDLYDGLAQSQHVGLGWASYTVLSSVLEREGFVIEGIPPNIWARKRP